MEDSEQPNNTENVALTLAGYILDPLIRLCLIISDLTDSCLGKLVPAKPPDIQLETNSSWGKVGNAIFQVFLVAIYYCVLGTISAIVSVGSTFLLFCCLLSLIFGFSFSFKVTSVLALLLLIYWRAKYLRD